jgi:hypothetical protein
MPITSLYIYISRLLSLLIFLSFSSFLFLSFTNRGSILHHPTRTPRFLSRKALFFDPTQHPTQHPTHVDPTPSFWLFWSPQAGLTEVSV